MERRVLNANAFEFRVFRVGAEVANERGNRLHGQVELCGSGFADNMAA